ncbi:MAG: DNA primase [bacterium]|nr:DNA primase [bacterium]
MVDLVTQIKERLNIVDFLKTYLQLSSAGKNFKAACPFHKEKTPSFIISPDRQIWHCFGCGAGGDMIGFLMRYENLEFVEALKVLADKTGLDFQHQGNSDQRQYDRLYKINQLAKDFFKNNLVSAILAQEYFKSRGLKPETIAEFELGAAPDNADALSRYLTKQGYNMAEIEKAGLVFKTQRGTYMDRFRNRLMFPLYNSFGKVIAFTGRVMPLPADLSAKAVSAEASAAKYVNSPETPIFNKSRLLFGLHKSKNEIRQLDAVVIVEGQMDFLMSWQDGIKNIVATSGTALTGDHLKLLRRFTGNMIVSFDSDEAGQLATERTIDMAQAADFSVKIIHLESKDPADIVKNNPGLMAKLVSGADSAMSYYFGRYLSTKDGDAALRKNNMRVLLTKLKNIYSPTEKGYWIKELSDRTGIGERFLLEEIDLIKSEPMDGNAKALPNSPEKQNLSRQDLIAQRLLSLVVADEGLADQLQTSYNYLPERYQAVFNYLRKSKDGATQAAATSQFSELLNLINLCSSLLLDQNKTKLAEEFQSLVKHLKLEHLRDRRLALTVLIKSAEQKDDNEELMKALREFDEISKEMQLT